ncbi:MAG: hypothetical protein QM656_07045 [Paracoccaceae bacterium]
MPKLVRLYIISVAIGFAISAVFVAGLVWLDVAGLRHLILETDKGWLAALMMFMFNGIVFAGVQFAIRIMGMAERDDGPRGGTRAPVVRPEPALIRATARR